MSFRNKTWERLDVSLATMHEEIYEAGHLWTDDPGGCVGGCSEFDRSHWSGDLHNRFRRHDRRCCNRSNRR
jgi:hypothetical protein